MLVLKVTQINIFVLAMKDLQHNVNSVSLNGSESHNLGPEDLS